MERLAIISWVLWGLVIWFLTETGDPLGDGQPCVHDHHIHLRWLFLLPPKVQFKNRQKTQAVYFNLQC